MIEWWWLIPTVLGGFIGGAKLMGAYYGRQLTMLKNELEGVKDKVTAIEIQTLKKGGR